jgi:hypothetical protein
MALGLRAWIGIAVVSCLAAALAFRPRSTPARPWYAVRPPAAESVGLWRRINAAHDQLTRLELRDSLLPLVHQAAAESRAAPLSLIDSGLDAEVRSRLQDLLDESLRPFGDPVIGPRIAVAVVVDTVPRVSGVPFRDRDELIYFLPQSTDGRTCLVVIAIRTPRRFEGGPRGESVPSSVWARGGAIGPCAYYATFGQPGEGIKRWLEDSNYTLALYPEWAYSSRAPRPRLAGWIERGDMLWFAPRLVACASGNVEQCRSAVVWVGGQGLPSGPSGVVSVGTRDHPLTAVGRYYLSDLLRDVRRTRFARFWSSELGVEDAFMDELGVSFTDWTVRWARAQVGKWEYGPLPRLSSLLSSLLLVGVFAVGSAWWAMRRQVA